MRRFSNMNILVTNRTANTAFAVQHSLGPGVGCVHCALCCRHAPVDMTVAAGVRRRPQQATPQAKGEPSSHQYLISAPHPHAPIMFNAPQSHPATFPLPSSAVLGTLRPNPTPPPSRHLLAPYLAPFVDVQASSACLRASSWALVAGLVVDVASRDLMPLGA